MFIDDLRLVDAAAFIAPSVQFSSIGIEFKLGEGGGQPLFEFITGRFTFDFTESLIPESLLLPASRGLDVFVVFSFGVEDTVCIFGTLGLDGGKGLFELSVFLLLAALML